MTILDKNTITLPNAQETYPNLVDYINEGLFHFTIPLIFLAIGVILAISGIGFRLKLDLEDRLKIEREEEGRFSRSLVAILLMLFSFPFFIVAAGTAAIIEHKVEKDTTLMAEHVSQHPETEDNVTVLANTIGFDYKDVCETILGNRESSLCGGEVISPITWVDNDDIYHIDPDYDYNDTEDELIVTFNLKNVTEEQS